MRKKLSFKQCSIQINLRGSGLFFISLIQVYHSTKKVLLSLNFSANIFSHPGKVKSLYFQGIHFGNTSRIYFNFVNVIWCRKLASCLVWQRQFHKLQNYRYKFLILRIVINFKTSLKFIPKN